MGEPTLRLLSLGAGVQSTTLALMAAHGDLPGLDGAIFADTGWEPRGVYEHLDRLEQVLTDAGIPLHRVSNGNLRTDSVDPAHRYASIPYYTQREPGPCQQCDATGSRDGEKCTRCAGTGHDDGRGIGRRQCTSEYKLDPIRRKTRELLGAKPPNFSRVPKGRVAEQWIGFSLDEVHRINDAHDVQYVVKRYPLIGLGMDRKACERWLRAHGWTQVAKSACIGCPFHGNRQWRELRDNNPVEWADAVEFDRQIRKGGARGLPLDGEAFLHASRVPLDQAPIDRVTRGEWRDRQVTVFDLLEDGDPDGCSPYGCRSGLPVEVSDA